jgi:hypothetical protein
MSDQTSPAPQPAPAASPAGRGTLMRWIQIGVGCAVVAVLAVIAIARFATRDDLPGCGSTQAKDTLSDIFKKNNVNASRYDEIKTLTTGNDEITCNAALTLRDDSKLVIDYRLYREGDGMKLLVTRSNP